MSLSIPELSVRYPENISSQTAPLVEEKLQQGKDYADDAIASAQAYLDALSLIFTSAAMPDVDIDYDFQEVSLEAEIESKRPAAPSDEDLTPGPVDSPVLRELGEVEIPDIDVPTDDTGEISTSLVFDEPAYVSDLVEAVKTSLLDYVQNGGTGLGADVEAAIWARAQARQDIVNERVYNEALNYFNARGFTIPPGALAGRLTEALAEQTRADAQLNYEIMIEQARLAQDMSKNALTISVQLEGVEKEFANRVAQRALDKTRAACDVIINTYNAKVTAYAARLEACKSKAQVAEIRANIQIAKGNQVVAIYAAEMEKYKADLAQELGIIETVSKVYYYKIAGYEADAKVAVGVLDAQVEAFKGRLTQANNQTQLSLKEAELVLQSYLGALTLQTEAAKGGANVTAQIAASALNAINVSASIGATAHWQQSESTGHQTSVSRSAQLSEQHIYSEES
jgi:hypothetical protein